MKYLVLVFQVVSFVVGRCGIVVDRCGSLWDRCGSVVDRCGSLWDRCGSVVDRCGSLWIVVDRCGSLWVVPGFSNCEDRQASKKLYNKCPKILDLKSSSAQIFSEN